MHALSKTDQAKAPTTQHRPRDPARDGASASGSNPVWQSLALRTASVRPKLAVGQPDDPDEREADRTAERVMRMPAPPASNFKPSPSSETHREDEEERLRREEREGDGDSASDAPPVVHEALGSAGQPLDPVTRSFMEERFDQDFGQVRVHTGARAAESARAVNALAYTLGRDVVFRDGQY